MASLLRLAPAGARIVLVGDENQLPPVGPGNVFGDVIRSGLCPVSRLQTVHRFGDGIGVVAQQILDGRFLTPNEDVELRKCSMEDVVHVAVTEGAQPLVPTNAARTLLNRAIQIAKSAGGLTVELTRDIPRSEPSGETSAP